MVKLTDPKLYEEEAYKDFDFVTEEKTVAVEAIKDVHRRTSYDGQRIWKKTVGPKYVTLIGKSEKKIARIPRGELIDVTVEVPVKESIDSRNRAQFNLRLAKAVNEYQDRVPDDVQKMLKAREEWGHFRDHDVAALLQADAEHRLMSRFIHTVHIFEEKDDTEFDGDLVDVLEAFNDSLKDELTSRYRHRALSRSTSVMANLFSDIDAEAMAEFINRNSWQW